MPQNAETALGQTGPFPEDMHGGAGLHGASFAHATDDAQPGLSLEEFRTQRAFERARRELTLDSIRAHLAEQPSPRTIRTCARRWANDINHLADSIITARSSTEKTP